MKDFTVNGKNYRSGKMTAMQQFHVSRRIAPVLVGLISFMGGEKKDAKFQDAIGPLLNALSQMNDADIEYVFGKCLSVVHMQQGANTWGKIWNDQANALMFDDLNMADMLQITAAVIQDNLSDFMRALPALAPVGAVPTA